MKTMLIFCLILGLKPLFAQNKEVETETQSWISYITQPRLSEKWSFWFDIHYHRKDYWVAHPCSN